MTTTPLHFGIFAPAGTIAAETRNSVLHNIHSYFCALGHQVSFSQQITHTYLRFAGDDEERLGGFYQLLEDPSIDVILALRGGYGVTRWLSKIDEQRIFSALSYRQTQRKNTLKIIGYSDVCVLLWYLYSQPSLHPLLSSYCGPMASGDFANHPPNPFTAEHFWAAMYDQPLHLSFATDANYPTTKSIKGRLWGGNLTMLCHTVGTPFMPQVSNGILFIEDINEPVYKIDRMLWQLYHSGLLQVQKALLIGGISGEALPDKGFDMPHIINEWRTRLSIPIIEGFPFGHIPAKATIEMGVKVELSLRDKVCTIHSVL